MVSSRCGEGDFACQNGADESTREVGVCHVHRSGASEESGLHLRRHCVHEDSVVVTGTPCGLRGDEDRDDEER